MAAAEPSDDINWTQKTAMLLHKCLSYSAHYLGAVEISNVEGAEDCRRAISASKVGECSTAQPPIKES